ncbi:hypothetical protein B0F90DRAFT_538102 [Multifurca ochricompacta]|uniref:MARVEL domain-containing protein n=1 Tax=Multifurca ochricompacta TaxID=376703 RepID=A0AAD4MDV1_9AGAM|nr:hypothetical protein B0F90DRAFT_538102 [Multifurca ochricompacta]
MTVLFRDLRLYGCFTVVLLSATVLGVSAYFASIFLPELHHDFSIYSLIPPSWTIFILIVLMVSSTPRADAIFLFITDILWLTLAAWSSDSLGSTQCDALGNSRANTKNGTMSARTYCDLSKVVEAFSWATFCLLTLYLIFVISLASRSVAMGRPYIWREDIRELPWFGQAPGYPGFGYVTYPSQYVPRSHPGPYTQYPTGGYGSNVVQQQPGHSLVIQPGRNGMPPTVQQVPTAV